MIRRQRQRQQQQHQQHLLLEYVQRLYVQRAFLVDEAVPGTLLQFCRCCGRRYGALVVVVIVHGGDLSVEVLEPRLNELKLCLRMRYLQNKGELRTGDDVGRREGGGGGGR